MQPGTTNNSANSTSAWQRWGYVGVGVFFFPGNLGVTSLWKMGETAHDDRYFFEALALLWFGVMAAQVLLLAIYGVWGAGPFYARLLGTIFVGLALVATYWLGNISVLRTERSPPPLTSQDLFLFAGMAPTLLLLVQSQLWLVRLYMGWQLVRLGTERRLRRGNQFSIADLMTVTLLVALVVGSCRWLFVLQRFDKTFLDFQFYLGCLLFIELPSVIPVVWGIFRPATFLDILSGPAIYGVIGVTVFTVLALLAVGNDPIGPLHFLAPFLGLTLGLIVPLLIARSQGYRLIWGRETEYPQVSAETGADNKASV